MSRATVPPYHFLCTKCQKMHKMPAYCIAQLASGYDLVHTCDCGNKNDLTPDMLNGEKVD